MASSERSFESKALPTLMAWQQCHELFRLDSMSIMASSWYRGTVCTQATTIVQHARLPFKENLLRHVTTVRDTH